MTRMDDGVGDLRSAIKKWNVIYPVYLNSKKTVAEGRRIAAAKACPDPTCVEIADCCSHLKIPHAIEVRAPYPSSDCFLFFLVQDSFVCTSNGPIVATPSSVNAIIH